MDTRTDLNNNNENTVTNFQREPTIEDWKGQDKQPDIIYIGAGPLGLLSAIDIMLKSLKGLCPPITITMFEKYPTPLRTQRLDIDTSIYKLIEDTPEFSAIVNQLSAKVVIKDLEQALRDFAISIGIEIIYEEVKNFDELEARFPDTQHFVGSGGVHGIVHSQVFNNEKSYDEAIRYAADVKYEVEGSTRALNRLLVAPSVLKQTQHTILEHVGREKNGKTAISLRTFIDQTTYEAMKEATSKKPYIFYSGDICDNKTELKDDRNKIDKELLRSIEIYLAARKEMRSEQLIDNKISIAMIGLRFRATKQFCTERNGKLIYQLGEEAFACPYQLSFNDNAKMLPHFSKMMLAMLNHEMIKLPKAKLYSSSLYSPSASEPKEINPIEYYQNFAADFIESEYKKVQLYDTGFEMLQSSIATTRSIPTPVSKIQLKSGGRRFFQDVKEINARYEQNVNDNPNARDSDDEEVVPSQKSKCAIM